MLSLLVILTTLFSLHHLTTFATAQTCYNPDGSIARYNYSCNSSISTSYQTCCSVGTFCTEANLCVEITEAYILFQRGSCTDPTFEDANCPRYCTGPDMRNGTAQACTATSTTTEICCIPDDETVCECTSGYSTADLGPLRLLDVEPAWPFTVGPAEPLPTQYRYLITGSGVQFGLVSSTVTGLDGDGMATASSGGGTTAWESKTSVVPAVGSSIATQEVMSTSGATTTSSTTTTTTTNTNTAIPSATSITTENPPQSTSIAVFPASGTDSFPTTLPTGGAALNYMPGSFVAAGTGAFVVGVLVEGFLLVF